MECNHNGKEGIGRIVFAESFVADGGCVECLLQKLEIQKYTKQDLISLVDYLEYNHRILFDKYEPREIVDIFLKKVRNE